MKISYARNPWMVKIEHPWREPILIYDYNEIASSVDILLAAMADHPKNHPEQENKVVR